MRSPRSTYSSLSLRRTRATTTTSCHVRSERASIKMFLAEIESDVHDFIATKSYDIGRREDDDL